MRSHTMGAMRSMASSLLVCCLVMLPSLAKAQVTATAAMDDPQVAFTGKAMPLLSLDTIHFLEGTWSATTRDGRTSLGSYSFVRQLNGHVLARQSATEANCDPAKQPVCARQDIFYVFQDSPGAPLQAISFDNEGHVVHYLVNLTTQASTSTLGKREFVIFDSDPSQLGPRVRLQYEHNIDTQTGKDVLNGAFEMLQPDGRWLPMQQWYGTRQ